MKAESFLAHDIEELQQQLADFKEFKPNLAFVFNSVSFDIEQIQKAFNKYSIPVFGMTTAGEIYNDGFYEQTIVYVLTDLSKDNYEIFYNEVKQDATLIDAGKLLALRAKEVFDDPHLIIAVSGEGLIDGDALLLGIIEVLGEHVKIFGGIAADELKFESSWVYTNDSMTNHGILGLILNGNNILVDGYAISGWEPLGDKKLITKSEGNVVYEIDGEPTIDAYIRYYGLSENLDEAVNILGNIGARYPLLVYRWERAPVIRTPVFGDKETRALTFAGVIPQNSEVSFTVPPTFEIMDTTIRKFKVLKQRFPEADFMLMFSCKARHIVFSLLLEDEIKGIRSYWNKPMAGLFTYGEFGNGESGEPDFHNETCTVVVFKEK